MKIIETLSDRISEEISDARFYAEWALEVKAEYPSLAKTLYNISEEEMEHMRMLHNATEDIIRAYREKTGDPPADMLAVYEYLHRKAVDKAADVKMRQAMFKDN